MACQNAGRGLPRCTYLVVTCAAFASSAASAGVIIDNFTDTSLPWPFIQDVVGSNTLTEAGLSGVVGGSRELTIEAQSLGIPGLDTIIIAKAPMPGLFDYNSSAQANGAVSFLYAGGGNLGADLSGQFQFEVVFTIFDFAGNALLPVTITLDDGSNTAIGTAALTAAGGQTLTLPFASFAGIGSIDLSSIDSIRVDLDAGEGVDMRISEIRAVVPAPASLALLGLGALAARRRRRSSLSPALNPRQQAG